jgi:uncharacterized membrane protein
VNEPDLHPTERDAARRHARGAQTVAANAAEPAKAAPASLAAKFAANGTNGANAPAPTAIVPVQPKSAAALVAAFTLVAMIALAVAWEWWLAPLRPGGSLLVLKALPLLTALPGVWRRRLYTMQWASMLILLYFAEGVVRGWSDHGASAQLGWLQAALAVIFFVCTLAYVGPFKRAAKRAAKEASAQPAEPAANRAANRAARQAPDEPPPPA